MGSLKILLVPSLLAFFATTNISYAVCKPACGSGQTCGSSGTTGEYSCRDTKGFQRSEPEMIERKGPSQFDKMDAVIQKQKTEEALRDTLKGASEESERKKIR